MSLLKCENVKQCFGGVTAVNKVNIQLNEGEIVGIIGPNGAGKTTLFNCITGIYTPTEGKILCKNIDITGLKPHIIAKFGLCRTFQNTRLFKDMTVVENVMVGMHIQTNANLVDVLLRLPRHKHDENKSEEKAMKILKLVDLYEYRYSYPDSLPYGSQRRLEIARAMASSSDIILLDEPAAGMHEQETIELMGFIKKLQNLGYSILLIEHDMKCVMGTCDRIYVLDHGLLIAQGNSKEIQQNPLVIEAYLGKEIY